MEVRSIRDFEREPIEELDHVLDSAVDQLVTLTQPKGYWPSLQDLLYQFSAMHLDAESPVRRFDFSLPSTCPQWPGPKFGSFSLHKVIAKPCTTAKAEAEPKRSSSSSQTGRRKTVLASKGCLGTGRTSRARQTPSQKSAVLVTTRTPPLRLVDLPPEIRNLVWLLLAARPKPVEAQLRRIQPCKKLTRHRQTFVRRFPQEPLVARANKQLRQEVLSIFYGSNHFVFERNNCSMFAQYGMLSPSNMLEWKPHPNLAACLTSVDVKFNALPRLVGMVQILYELRRKPDGFPTIRISVESTAGKKKRGVEADAYCLCDERGIATAVLDAATNGHEQDLALWAVDLVQMRNDKLFSGLTVTGKSGNYFPPKSTCGRCAKPTFERVYSGV